MHRPRDSLLPFSIHEQPLSYTQIENYQIFSLEVDHQIFASIPKAHPNNDEQILMKLLLTPTPTTIMESAKLLASTIEFIVSC